MASSTWWAAALISLVIALNIEVQTSWFSRHIEPALASELWPWYWPWHLLPTGYLLHLLPVLAGYLFLALFEVSLWTWVRHWALAADAWALQQMRQLLPWLARWVLRRPNESDELDEQTIQVLLLPLEVAKTLLFLWALDRAQVFHAERWLAAWLTPQLPDTMGPHVLHATAHWRALGAFTCVRELYDGNAPDSMRAAAAWAAGGLGLGAALLGLAVLVYLGGVVHGEGYRRRNALWEGRHRAAAFWAVVVAYAEPVVALLLASAAQQVAGICVVLFTLLVGLEGYMDELPRVIALFGYWKLDDVTLLREMAVAVVGVYPLVLGVFYLQLRVWHYLRLWTLTNRLLPARWRVNVDEMPQDYIFERLWHLPNPSPFPDINLSFYHALIDSILAFVFGLISTRYRFVVHSLFRVYMPVSMLIGSLSSLLFGVVDPTPLF
ncbi:hypothetical protein F4780DRAFT_780696 [Xylariomycetidae sp. FL0641]|nr:hypothetical protein F4780DRAFT_780696 [Xylariomycetidae sp. FL0641]